MSDKLCPFCKGETDRFGFCIEHQKVRNLDAVKFYLDKAYKEIAEGKRT